MRSFELRRRALRCLEGERYPLLLPFALGFALGCARANADASAESDASQAGLATTTPGGWQSHTDFLLRAMSADIVSPLRAWAARWAAATGLTLTVDVQGIPFALRTSVSDRNGATACAVTSELAGPAGSGQYRVLEVQLANPVPAGCPGWAVSIGHELGHVLAGPEAPHASSGIFMPSLPPGAPA
ncbi:MAG TPA: hypothetical protein VG963_14890, partial [Polyangiaceae bacterium]|nr:hypothetical protein [Polyangiaceae bacterium]